MCMCICMCVCVCVCVYIYKEIYFKELVHVIVKSIKFEICREDWEAENQTGVDAEFLLLEICFCF